jgi:hypothetical protein
MVRFELDDATRLALLPHHRAFQATVARTANELMKWPDTEPQGIGKYQGGIFVAGRPICLFPGGAKDDISRYDDTPKREENAAAEAVRLVCLMFNQQGASVLEQPTPGNLRDPLRSFFEPVMPKGHQL